VDTAELMHEPEAVITEDGYLFFRLPDGRYVDNPDKTDFVYPKAAQNPFLQVGDISRPTKPVKVLHITQAVFE